MNTTCASPVPFAELPLEARALLFIFANAAAASYVSRPPQHAELAPLIESIWNRQLLCFSDLADPDRLIDVFVTEFALHHFAGKAKRARQRHRKPVVPLSKRTS